MVILYSFCSACASENGSKSNGVHVKQLNRGGDSSSSSMAAAHTSLDSYSTTAIVKQYTVIIMIIIYEGILQNRTRETSVNISTFDDMWTSRKQQSKFTYIRFLVFFFLIRFNRFLFCFFNHNLSI